MALSIDGRQHQSAAYALGDVLLKPDIVKWLVAYIDRDDVRGVSLLDCAISDVQYLRPRFLHMLGSGQLVLRGLDVDKYGAKTAFLAWDEPETTRTSECLNPYASPGYMRWLVLRNITVRCVTLGKFDGMYNDTGLCRNWHIWINRHSSDWSHVVIVSDSSKVSNRFLETMSENGKQENEPEEAILPRLQSIKISDPINMSSSSIFLGPTETTILPLNLSVLGRCSSLESIVINSNIAVTDISDLGRCAQLKYLQLDMCTRVADVSPLKNCSMLEYLSLGGCPMIEDVTALGACRHLKGLRDFRIDYCEGNRLAGIGALTKDLEFLELNGVTNSDISLLGEFTNLNVLILHKSDGEEPEISALSHCKRLDLLKLDMEDLQSIAPLALCPALRHVELNCDALEDIDALGACALLEKVVITSDSVTDVATPLSRCPQLKELCLLFCHEVRDLSLISNCTQLRRFKLIHCVNVSDISFLGSCINLVNVLLGLCHNITDFSALAQCKKLKGIKLAYCRGITDIDFASGCTSLERFLLSDSEIISNLSPLAHCDQLRSVQFDRCEALEDISALSHCPALESVRLSKCPNITAPNPTITLLNSGRIVTVTSQE
jgi:Leucine-rich repeat (LRR) protein